MEAHGRVGDARTHRVLLQWPAKETPIADIVAAQSLIVDICAPAAGEAEHIDIARRSVKALSTLPGYIAILLHNATYTVQGGTKVVSFEAAAE